jgi:hypothetical protein
VRKNAQGGQRGANSIRVAALTRRGAKSDRASSRGTAVDHPHGLLPLQPVQPAQC